MQVFITGATGFIGTVLTHKLVEQGHDVTVLLRSPKKLPKLPKDKIRVIEGDLSIFENPDLELPPFDVVIHLAGSIFAKNRDGYFKGNFEATKHLIEAIKRQPWQLKRFLYASSLAAAGPSTIGRPHVESDNLLPVDWYGESKKASEDYLQTLDIPTTSFRPAIVFGPGDENSLDLYKMTKRGIAPRVAGFDQELSWVDVDDAVDGIILMMKDERPEHQQFFIAHPDHSTIKTIWFSLGKVMKRSPLRLPLPKGILYVAMLASTGFSKIFGTFNKLDRKQYSQMVEKSFLCSGEKLQTELGWDPKYGLEACFRRSVEGYKKLGWL